MSEGADEGGNDKGGSVALAGVATGETSGSGVWRESVDEAVCFSATRWDLRGSVVLVEAT